MACAGGGDTHTHTRDLLFWRQPVELIIINLLNLIWRWESIFLSAFTSDTWSHGISSVTSDRLMSFPIVVSQKKEKRCGFCAAQFPFTSHQSLPSHYLWKHRQHNLHFDPLPSAATMAWHRSSAEPCASVCVRCCRRRCWNVSAQTAAQGGQDRGFNKEPTELNLVHFRSSVAE